jgi:nitroreductase
MEFLDVLKMRQSVRAYQDRALEEEKLHAILEAAACAPSAGNLQSYEIFIARQVTDRKALAQAALGQEFVAGAPVSLVFCTNAERARHKYGQRGTGLYALQDATIACTYAMLAATEVGLACVWIGAFRDEEVRRAIRAPIGLLPVAILSIGYPAERPEPTPRRALGDLIHEL